MNANAQGISWGGHAASSGNAAIAVEIPVEYVPYRKPQPAESISSGASPLPSKQIKLSLHITARVDEIIDKITALVTLERGWNSYQAGRISDVAQDHAARFLRLLANREMRVPMPSVAPTFDGGVSLHWNVGAHEVNIVFTDDGQEYTVAHRGSDKVLDGGFVEKPEKLKDAIGLYLPR